VLLISHRPGFKKEMRRKNIASGDKGKKKRENP